MGRDSLHVASAVGAMRDRLLRIVRAVAAATFVGALCVVLTAPGSKALPSASQPFAVLNGEGSSSLDVQLVSMQNELASAKSWINLKYIPIGTQLARDDLAAKQTDFAISSSGIPFSADELKQVPGGASGLISAPIQVATLGTFVEQPFGGFQSFLCNPDDPTTYPTAPPPGFDPNVDCFNHVAYKAPIRIPTNNLAAMFLHYVAPGPDGQPLRAWNSRDVVKANGVSWMFAFPGQTTAGPGYSGRSDPDEMNYYLQTFVKTAAPDVWNGNKQAVPQVPWDPITERMGQVVGVVRQGVEQQLEQLASGGCGVNGACNGDAGGLAPAPPSEIKNLRPGGRSGLLFAGQDPILLAEMQNANGDWVAPTTDAIDKAVDAGGTKPLFALTNKVAGAYPLVWVDNLYAPAHGLSIEKTEGMAMLIRYLATTGQKRSTAVGEGRLPAALVTQSLAAADQLVRSNCVGSDRKIVSSSDPGPLAPATATEMRSIGSMLHCEPAGGTIGQTTPSSSGTAPNAPGSSSTPSGGSAGSSSSPLGSSSLRASGASGASGSASPSSGAALASSAASGARSISDATSPSGSGGANAKNKHTGLLVAGQLPLPMPGGAGAGDRAATFVLGAGLFLVLRKPVTALVRSLAR